MDRNNLSNNLKALLYLGDIIENKTIHQYDCFTIQDFHYTCLRHRDDAGLPCGPTQCAQIHLTIKLMSGNKTKRIYEQLISNEVFSFSFIFNATFDHSNNKKVSNYADAMMINGSVIDINEEFNTNDQDSDEMQRMLMSIDIMIQSITYIGAQNNKTLYLNQI